MTSKYFFTLAALGSLAALGCGGGNSGTGTGGGTTSTHTLTHPTTTSSNSSSSMTTSNTGTGGGSTNHDPADATSVMVGSQTMAALQDAMTPDFYSFTATAGERLYIAVVPTDLAQFTDPTQVDPAIALFDMNANLKMPLTYQNGSVPYSGQDAVLYVQVPTAGTYYILVADCNGFFSGGCPNPASGITDFNYTLSIADTSKLNSPELLAASTQTGMTANAQTVTYKAGTMAGTYIDQDIGGDWKSATDTHVFAFSPPSAATVQSGANPRADFYFQQIGGAMTQGGDLSTGNAKAWITDSTGTKIISQTSQSNYGAMTIPMDLSIQYKSGSMYYLFVQNTDPTYNATGDFYFTIHNLNSLIDVAEKEVYDPTMPASAQAHTNDTPATAELLQPQGTAKTLFAVDGNVSVPGSASAPAVPDLDYYTFTVPNQVTQYGYQCDSARSGSGLGSFKITLYQSDGTTMITSGTESATMDLFMNPVTLPAAVTNGSKMYFEVQAATQDATVTGAQYRCYVFFQ